MPTETKIKKGDVVRFYGPYMSAGELYAVVRHEGNAHMLLGGSTPEFTLVRLAPTEDGMNVKRGFVHATNERRGIGYYLQTDEPALPEAEVDSLVMVGQALDLTAQEKCEAKANVRDERRAEGLRILMARAPEWAQAVIVASHEVDDCDSMSDYFATKTTRHLFLGWSRHTRDLFGELRKAALNCPETEHLGPGRDVYWVYLAWDHDGVNKPEDVWLNYSEPYWKDTGVPTHFWDDLVPEGIAKDFHGRVTLSTEAKARQLIESLPRLAGAYWRVARESVEHRDKYAGGKGYYLKDGGPYSTGWMVHKDSLAYSLAHLGVSAANPGNWFTTAASGNSNGDRSINATATMTVNDERNGVELTFSEKPSEDVRSRLKATGFRWSRRQGLWYARQSEGTLSLARELSGAGGA